MQLFIAPTADALGRAAAAAAVDILREVLDRQATARLVVATGTSQLATLRHLTAATEIDWRRVDAFHLDEYVGIEPDHPASFVNYLQTHFAAKLPLRSMHFLDGRRDPMLVCGEASTAIAAGPIDLALIGIGENGHLAFNDPPADFVTERPYLVVELDEACRRQQVGEGWFATIEQVPKRAVSMSIHRILQADSIICSVPDERKAIAVQKTVEGPITPNVPASVLQRHANIQLYCDEAAAGLLDQRTRSSATFLT